MGHHRYRSFGDTFGALPCLDAVLSCKYSKKILNLKKGKIVSIIVIAAAVVPLRHNLGQLQDMRY